MCIASQRHREGAILPDCTIHKPHRDDKAHRTQHADRRKVLHRVETVVLQDGECRRISQGNRRHEESHTQRIECNKGCLVCNLVAEACLKAHAPAAQHKAACQQMTESQQSLRLDILIGDDTHQCGHKETDNTLNRIEPGYLITQSSNTQIVSHTGQIGTPHGKLQEIH